MELNAAIARIEKLKNKISDETKKNIGKVIHDEIMLRFDREEDANGRKWEPLVFRRRKILQDTNKLRNEIETQIDGDTIKVGSNTMSKNGWAYGITHQYGAHIKAKNKPYLVFRTPKGFIRKKEVFVPARPFLGFNDKLLQKCSELLNNI